MPFCGGEATFVYCETGSKYISNRLYMSKRGTVKCKKCGIRLPRIYSKVSRSIEAWNRRSFDVTSEDVKKILSKEMSCDCGCSAL